MTQSDLVIRYSAEFGELDLSGPVAALEELADALGLDGAERVTGVEGDPSPYSGFLTGVRVRLVGQGRVRLSVDRDRRALTFTGSPDHMAVLADNLRGLGREGVPGEHLHVEYFPGHFYLAESAVSLVVSRVD